MQYRGTIAPVLQYIPVPRGNIKNNCLPRYPLPVHYKYSAHIDSSQSGIAIPVFHGITRPWTCVHVYPVTRVPGYTCVRVCTRGLECASSSWYCKYMYYTVHVYYTDTGMSIPVHIAIPVRVPIWHVPCEHVVHFNIVCCQVWFCRMLLLIGIEGKTLSFAWTLFPYLTLEYQHLCSSLQ